MKRFKDESFIDYKERRALLVKANSGYRKGLMVRSTKVDRSPYVKKTHGLLKHAVLKPTLTELYGMPLAKLKQALGVV